MKNTILWTPASKPPIRDNPGSTIFPCILTVEFPDDPFKPGFPYRDVLFSAWWSFMERNWFVNGVTREDLKVIAWTHDVSPYEGPEL